MEVETPETIAVLGAGPMGLEAALYGRFLGYSVTIYERGRIAENMLRWGHVRLFSPFAMNRSPLGIAAIEAQDPLWQPPADDALLTGRQHVERYLLPLAKTDLLARHVRERTVVIAIGREGCLKGDLVGDEDRGERPFRVLTRRLDSSQGRETERVDAADFVIDTTGTYGNHNWLGASGMPALGEIEAAGEIEYGLPDFSGEARELYAGRHTLLVGSGYSAAANAVALAELAEESPQTRVTWVTRARPGGESLSEPMALIPDDRLVERDQLARAANRLAAPQAGPIRHVPGTSIVAIQRSDDAFTIRCAGRHAVPLLVDRIIANVGFRPDNQIYSELQVHECYASGGPMKLAAALLEQSSADCLDQQAAGAAKLVTPEPNFYILGAKSYGRNSTFLMSAGLEQIREVFSIIGEREELDLYSTIVRTK